MVKLRLLVFTLTTIVTIVAGIPYVVKFGFWLFIRPKFDIDAGVSNDLRIKHHHDTTMIVNIEYLHSQSLPERMSDVTWMNTNALFAVREYGPFLLPPGELLPIKPQPEIEETREIKVKIRPRMRLSDYHQWIPTFWGEVELRPQTLKCEIGPDTIPDPSFHPSE